MEFTPDSTYLNSLLEYPNRGNTFCKKSIVIETYFPEYNVDNGVSTPTMQSCSPTDHVFPHIISRILAPTEGYRTNVSNFRSHILYAITRHVSVNYCAFMTVHMKLCRATTGHDLCFSYIITRILRFHNVSLTADPNFTVPVSIWYH
ncbi:hypothetical protein ACH5RR_007019 [Cinchona calisaya]|uniref:Uncharacterized protein n=1 Tax=Cinchona calisaya TaxID=153742 RepID=A0ABD3AQL9_9GENT